MLNEFIAGGLAGMVSVVAGQPLDTIKVKLQTSTKYSGILDCSKRIVQKEGFMGLFRGIIPPLLTATVQNAVVFTTNRFVLGHVQEYSEYKGQTYSHLFVSGAVSGLVSSVIQCPTELVKIRLQLFSKDAYKSTSDCFMKSYKQGGMRALFQGFNVTAFREVSAFSFYFSSHKFFEQQLNRFDVFNPFFSSFIAGGGAGAVSWVVCYPFDMAKTEIQMLNYSSAPSSKSFVNILERMYSQHGIKYIYRGIGATIARSFPVNAVLFPTHKFFSQLLDQNCNIKRIP